MPRYLFHVRTPSSYTIDEIGVHLDGLDEMLAEAHRGARAILAEYLKAGVELDHQQFEIMDESGALVAVVRFRDLVVIAPERPDPTKS